MDATAKRDFQSLLELLLILFFFFWGGGGVFEFLVLNDIMRIIKVQGRMYSNYLFFFFSLFSLWECVAIHLLKNKKKQKRD